MGSRKCPFAAGLLDIQPSEGVPPPESAGNLNRQRPPSRFSCSGSKDASLLGLASGDISEDQSHCCDCSVQTGLVRVGRILALENDPSPTGLQVTEAASLHGNSQTACGIAVPTKVSIEELHRGLAVAGGGSPAKISDDSLDAQACIGQPEAFRSTAALDCVTNRQLIVVQAITGEDTGYGVRGLEPAIDHIPTIYKAIPLSQKRHKRGEKGIAEEETVLGSRIIPELNRHERKFNAPVRPNLTSAFVFGYVLIVPQAEISVQIKLGPWSASQICPEDDRVRVEPRVPEFRIDLELFAADPGQVRRDSAGGRPKWHPLLKQTKSLGSGRTRLRLRWIVERGGSNCVRRRRVTWWSLNRLCTDRTVDRRLCALRANDWLSWRTVLPARLYSRISGQGIALDTARDVRAAVPPPCWVAGER